MGIDLTLFLSVIIGKVTEKTDIALMYQISPLDLSSILKKIYILLINANPIILILLGIVVFFGGKLAKFVGIIIVIFGLFQFILSYFITI